jgi:phenylacetate-CoA ligase
MSSILGKIVYKLWDAKEGGVRLSEMEMLKRLQYLPQEKLVEYQNERLIKLLKHASQKSPWYKRKFQDLGMTAKDIQTVEDLTKLPITKKIDIRNNRDAFISEDENIASLVTAKTGGSTGVSLDLFFDKYCQKLRNGAQGFADNLAGWEPGDKVAALWGNPPIAKTIKEKLRSSLLERTKYLDTMDLNPISMGEFATEWRSFQPDVVFGHAHSIFIFAQFLIENKISLQPPKGIVATSMMLLEHERKCIEKAFGAKVTNRYGCEEVGLIACECERHKGMHINSPHVIVECVDDTGKPVPYGKAGKLVITDLNNLAMPLIRYQIEDVGVLSSDNCACGRNLPILEKLEGRVADFLKKADGGLVGGVSLVERTLTKIPGIEQMQFVQKSINKLIVNRVKGHEFNQETDTQLLAELHVVFGDSVEVLINDIEKMPQEASGKYRFSICEV